MNCPQKKWDLHVWDVKTANWVFSLGADCLPWKITFPTQLGEKASEQAVTIFLDMNVE
jgi:hypothetical protein